MKKPLKNKSDKEFNFSRHGSIVDEEEEEGSSDFEIDPMDEDYIFYEIKQVKNALCVNDSIQ